MWKTVSGCERATARTVGTVWVLGWGRDQHGWGTAAIHSSRQTDTGLKVSKLVFLVVLVVCILFYIFMNDTKGSLFVAVVYLCLFAWCLHGFCVCVCCCICWSCVFFTVYVALCCFSFQGVLWCLFHNVCTCVCLYVYIYSTLHIHFSLCFYLVCKLWVLLDVLITLSSPDLLVLRGLWCTI